MGTYTEILIKAPLKKILPPDVEQVLQYLFNDAPEPPTTLPNHPFFSYDNRWELIGNSSSYYHIPWSASKYQRGYLFSRSDLKNYNREISTFFDWLRPYLLHDPIDKESPRVCIGWMWHEEADKPTLVYNK